MNLPPQEPPSPSETKPSSSTPSLWEIYYPSQVGGHRDAVLVASFPEITYFWPTIVTMFFCAFLQGVVGVDGSTLGWFSIAILSLNLLVLVQDFDQKKFAILSLSLLAIGLITWIISLYGFTFIKRIVHWIFSFEPAISTDAYILIGSVLLVLFIWGIITPLFSYWKLEENEFLHYTQPIGKDMSIARLGCTIYKEIPDVFEFILGFGSGTLVIRKDNQVVATIAHVPFLAQRMKAIEHLLSETRVVVEKEN